MSGETCRSPEPSALISKMPQRVVVGDGGKEHLLGVEVQIDFAHVSAALGLVQRFQFAVVQAVQHGDLVIVAGLADTGIALPVGGQGVVRTATHQQELVEVQQRVGQQSLALQRQQALLVVGVERFQSRQILSSIGIGVAERGDKILDRHANRLGRASREIAGTSRTLLRGGRTPGPACPPNGRRDAPLLEAPWRDRAWESPCPRPPSVVVQDRDVASIQSGFESVAVPDHDLIDGDHRSQVDFPFRLGHILGGVRDRPLLPSRRSCFRQRRGPSRLSGTCWIASFSFSAPHSRRR